MNYVINDEGNITAIVNGSVLTVSKSHLNYNALYDALKRDDEDLFVELYSVRDTFAKRTGGKVSIDGNVVKYNGVAVHNTLTDRMLKLLDDGFDIEPWMHFLERLMKNPSARAIEEAYNFLQHQDMPLTEDGYVLGFKGVQDNYYSCTAGSLNLIQGKTDDAGRIYNGIGEVIECPRNEVDDNCNRTCSKGIHIGALSYAQSFGPRTVIVKFDPADIVSIPTDANGRKCRACKYEVVSDYVPLKKSVVNPTVLRLQEDQAYEFEYKGELRRVLVEEKHDKYITCRCLVGDKSESMYRNFDLDKVSNVKAL